MCGESRIGMKMDSQVKEEDIKTLEYLCYVGLFVSFLSFPFSGEFFHFIPFRLVSFCCVFRELGSFHFTGLVKPLKHARFMNLVERKLI